jgi:lipopolysaccharide/colanic/teichoic acid biosynthesis glycosyltransferase
VAKSIYKFTTIGGLDGAVASTPIGHDDARTAALACETRLRRREVACRILDIVGAAILLVVFAPVLLVVALAIRLDSRGPALFRQPRVGRDLVLFEVCKFRTMHHGVSHDSHRAFVLNLIAGERRGEASTSEPGVYKMVGDERVTRLGRILRRLSIDELPQLWNVLRGDMSLVGPRPPVLYEVEHYPPHWFARFAVKPGVTGLWQVSGRSTVTLEDMVRLDVEYIRRRSLWFNVWILLRTIPAVLSCRGAS